MAKKPADVKPKIKSIDDIKKSLWNEFLTPPSDTRGGKSTFQFQEGNPVHESLMRSAKEVGNINITGADRSDAFMNKRAKKHINEGIVGSALEERMSKYEARHSNQLAADIGFLANEDLFKLKGKNKIAIGLTDKGKKFVENLAEDGIRIGFDYSHLHLDPRNRGDDEIKGMDEFDGKLFLESQDKAPSPAFVRDLKKAYARGLARRKAKSDDPNSVNKAVKQLGEIIGL